MSGASFLPPKHSDDSPVSTQLLDGFSRFQDPLALSTMQVLCRSGKPRHDFVMIVMMHFKGFYGLSLISMFQNCAMFQCSLRLFRSWGKSFSPVPAGTRSKTRPRRLRAGF